MKKFMTFLIFMFCLVPTAVFADGYEATVRVGLYYGSTARDSVKIGSKAGIVIYDADGMVIADADEAVITKGESGFVSDGLFEYPDGNAITILPNDYTIYVEGKSYRGYILLLRQSGSDMTVINVVDTEDYVASVCGKEMSPSWHIEALKAQALCARNYAFTQTKHQKYGFDVCATTDCQVYRGVEGESESTVKAAEATRGQVVMYDGKIVPLYFFASDGGMTEDCKNVWGSESGYLKSVRDDYESENASRHSWTVEMTFDEISAKLTSAGLNIGELLSVRVDEYSDAGSVLKITFVGSEDTRSFQRERARTILGLSSQAFTLTLVGGDSRIVLFSQSGRVADNPSVLTANGQKKLAGSAVLGADGVSVKQPDIPTDGEKRYIINGAGYGHRIGLSQWGAKAMAEAGFSHEDIIKFYYTDVDIVTYYLESADETGDETEDDGDYSSLGL